MLLTAELLFNYQRCRRRSFLDTYGDAQQQGCESDFLLKLQQNSWAHRQAIVADMTYHQPQYPRRDFIAGAEATLELMRQGVDLIYQGILRAEGPAGFTLASSPDLLIKQPGESSFGNWLYVPTDIKLGKRPKLDYQIIVAFHAYVLASVQGVSPETAGLLLREKGAYRVNLGQRMPQMQQMLTECIEMLHHRQEPEVFIARHPCSHCHWYGSCYAIATETKHLSLLPGVTPVRYTQLQALNLTTVEALAGIDPGQLAHLTEFPDEVAGQLVLQAQSVLQNQAIATPAGLSLSPSELPTALVELYFDIEAQPELDLAFLHGVLVVDRQAKTETFYPLLAEQPAEEGAIWEQLLNLIWTYPDAPIFHFCDYEVQTFKQFAKRYNTPSHLWRPVLSRFVDVHERVTRAAILPVESYALKAIARWVGFEWRDRQANGAQCIFWYDRWLETGDRTFLDAIRRYNEDDCRATYVVKDWLVNFLQNADRTLVTLS
ncbi:TM0106 family RecB-like putative nuclease [Microcoleus sp. FACHB-672]|uniref:TM0106 family RecB-like putative nuclease n=1 Tax=Microcoleus sp. FACHB-672 TaxID=2692825 RepID=UPI0016872E1A|nr:TM0106 family RecB-like putative nuclease [Microcoleus sp. FACHB-672]MBD2040714.1 TM0106 family RecB-like putative nuclease [Microcoleus sp. FACHB-672]